MKPVAGVPVGWFVARVQLPGIAAIALIAWACPALGQDAGEAPLVIPTPAGVEVGDPLVAQAIREAIAKVRASPGEAIAWEAMAKLYIAHTWHPEAIACLDEASSLDGLSTRGAYLRALSEHSLGEVERSVESLGEVAERAPDYAPAWWRRGQAQLELGRIEEASRSFERALAVDSESPAAWAGLARAHLQRREAVEAERVVREHLLGGPGEKLGRQLLASALRMQGRLDEARQEMVRAGDGAVTWDDPWLAEVMALRTGRDAEKRRFDALMAQRRYTEAEAVLRRMREHWPDDTALLNDLGAVRCQLGDIESGLEVWRRVLEIDPGNSHAHLNLGFMLASRAVPRGESVAPALEHLRASVESNPANVRAWSVYGSLLLRAGAVNEAEACFERVLEVDADNTEALGQLGMIALRGGALVRASEMFERVTRLAPDDARGHLSLAQVQIELGDLDEAERSIEAAGRLVGSRAGQVQAARAMLRRARASAGDGG